MIKLYCPHCNKEVNATVKLWNTIICNECNRIISSDKSISKEK